MVVRRRAAGSASGMPAVLVSPEILVIGAGRLLRPPIGGVFRLPALGEIRERVTLDRDILSREIVGRASLSLGNPLPLGKPMSRGQVLSRGKLLFRGPLPPPVVQRAQPVVRGIKAPLQLGIAEVRLAP